eukprot:m.68540 g.68540  ORF g.68540 m.68540 type:complete len:215 (+) comp8517_c0_seq2:286-930(+)
MGGSRRHPEQAVRERLVLSSHVATELLLLHVLLVADLALNSASIALIHETSTITVVGLQVFLCLLHVVCLSVCILETRYYKLGEWKNLRRFRPVYLCTALYFAMLVAYFVQLTKNNPKPNSFYESQSNATYNQHWDNEMHSFFALQKTTFVIHAIASRVAIVHLSNPKVFSKSITLLIHFHVTLLCTHGSRTVKRSTEYPCVCIHTQCRDRSPA